MARRQAMGNDPLDWIGKSSPPAPDNVDEGSTLNPPASPSPEKGLNGKNGVGAKHGTNGFSITHPSAGCVPHPINGSNGTHATTGSNGGSDLEPSEPASVSGTDAEEITGGASSALLPQTSDFAGFPVPSRNTNAALEREVLLFGDFRNDLRVGRAQRSNQILLVLIFVFIFVGGGLLFVNRTRQQHEDHVASLQDRVQTMKLHSTQVNSFLQTIISSKDDAIQAREDALAARDQVIAEKERVITNLRVIQRSSIRDMVRELTAALDFGVRTREIVSTALGLSTIQRLFRAGEKLPPPAESAR